MDSSEKKPNSKIEEDSNATNVNKQTSKRQRNKPSEPTPIQLTNILGETSLLGKSLNEKLNALRAHKYNPSKYQFGSIPSVASTSAIFNEAIVNSLTNNGVAAGIPILATSPSVNLTFDLQEEILKLKKELSKMGHELQGAMLEKKTSSQQIEELTMKMASKEEELEAKSTVAHILPRIMEPAKEKLLLSKEFVKEFENGKDVECIVVSIDIRRSTELMLKARTPQKYAEFIVRLSESLKQAIIANFGIFDKFTGDGILSFFPKFYSGKDAMFYALRATKLCHQIFKEHYYNSRDTFNVFIKDVGLGIGVDFGTVSLVNYASDLTVVGIPVVYACRMSGAPAGHTFLNQPAMENAMELYGKFATLTESQLDIKNEGIALTYQIEINEKSIDKIKLPDWYPQEEVAKNEKAKD